MGFQFRQYLFAVCIVGGSLFSAPRGAFAQSMYDSGEALRRRTLEGPAAPDGPDAARARPGADAKAPSISRPATPWTAAAVAGVGWGSFEHPEVARGTAAGPMLTLSLSREILRGLSVGVEVNGLQAVITREAGRGFVVGNASDEAAALSGGGLRLRASCQDCRDNGPPRDGGYMVSGPLTALGISPRIEWAPLGETGPYAAASVGVGMMLGLDTRTGLALAGRGGVRARLAPAVALSAEGGATGFILDGANANAPFAAGRLDVFF